MTSMLIDSLRVFDILVSFRSMFVLWHEMAEIDTLLWQNPKLAYDMISFIP